MKEASAGRKGAAKPGPPTVRRHVLALVTAAVVTELLLVAGYGLTPGVTQLVGDGDGLVFRGFSEPESVEGTSCRWSRRAIPGTGTAVSATDSSAIALPQVGESREGLLDLDLRAGREDPPVPLTLTAGGHELLATTVHDRVTLSVRLEGEALSGGGLAVQFWSPPSQSPGATGSRGVAIAAVRWRPLGFTYPPGRQLWLFPALAIALSFLLLLIGGSPPIAGLGGMVLGGGLALAAGLRPLEVGPFTPYLLLMVVLAQVALLMWAGLVRTPAGGGWRPPAAVGPAPLLVLLGVVYWMFPLFQRLLCHAAGPALCPRSGTEFIGAVVLTALVVLLGAPDAWRPRAALLALGLGGSAEALYAGVKAFRRPAVDFLILWNAARDFHHGRPLYKMAAILSENFGVAFRVPPFYAMLYLPFTTGDPERLLRFHRVLNVTLYGITALILVVLGRARLGFRLALAAVAIVMGLMQPPFDTVAYGQIDIVLLLLLSLALVGLVQERPWLVGFAIALATVFKLYPILVVAFLLARREWKAVAWTGAALGLLTGAALAVMGWKVHLLYVTQVLPHLGGGTSWVENQALNGFLSRLMTDAPTPTWIHDRTLDALTYAGFLVIVGASTLLATRPSERGSSRYAVQFSLFSVAMILSIPAAWVHYSTITILPFVALLWRSAESPLSRGGAFLLALSFGLVGYGNQWSFFAGWCYPGLPMLGLSQRFYGLVGLWGLAAGSILWPGGQAPPWPLVGTSSRGDVEGSHPRSGSVGRATP